MTTEFIKLTLLFFIAFNTIFIRFKISKMDKDE